MSKYFIYEKIGIKENIDVKIIHKFFIHGNGKSRTSYLVFLVVSVKEKVKNYFQGN